MLEDTKLEFARLVFEENAELYQQFRAAALKWRETHAKRAVPTKKVVEDLRYSTDARDALGTDFKINNNLTSFFGWLLEIEGVKTTRRHSFWDRLTRFERDQVLYWFDSLRLEPKHPAPPIRTGQMQPLFPSLGQI